MEVITKFTYLMFKRLQTRNETDKISIIYVMEKKHSALLPGTSGNTILDMIKKTRFFRIFYFLLMEKTHKSYTAI